MKSKQSPIMTLAIRLDSWRGNEWEWRRTIEIPAKASLHQVHLAIQRMIGFDNDHMYTFYLGRHWRQRQHELAPAAMPIDRSDFDDILLCEVFPLQKNQKLFYWFDFGDDWIFHIGRRLGKKPFDRRVRYPRVIEEHGPNPKQYDS